MNKLKVLLPGILIGVLITVASMFAWNYAEDVATKKMAEKFLSGHQQAEDKVAFAEEFATDKGGLSVSISTSDASGCDRWMKYAEYYFEKAMDIITSYPQPNIDVETFQSEPSFADVPGTSEPSFGLSQWQTKAWFATFSEDDRGYISAYLQAADEMGGRYGDCMENLNQ
jgi:hypothetical protein